MPYKKGAAVGSSVTLLVCSLVLLGLYAACSNLSCAATEYSFGSPIWTGVLTLGTSLVGIYMTRTRSEKGCGAFFLVLSIFGMLTTLACVVLTLTPALVALIIPQPIDYISPTVPTYTNATTVAPTTSPTLDYMTSFILWLAMSFVAFTLLIVTCVTSSQSCCFCQETWQQPPTVIVIQQGDLNLAQDIDITWTTDSTNNTFVSPQGVVPQIVPGAPAVVQFAQQPFPGQQAFAQPFVPQPFVPQPFVPQPFVPQQPAGLGQPPPPYAAQPAPQPAPPYPGPQGAPVASPQMLQPPTASPSAPPAVQRSPVHHQPQQSASNQAQKPKAPPSTVNRPKQRASNQAQKHPAPQSTVNRPKQKASKQAQKHPPSPPPTVNRAAPTPSFYQPLIPEPLQTGSQVPLGSQGAVREGAGSTHPDTHSSGIRHTYDQNLGRGGAESTHPDSNSGIRQTYDQNLGRSASPNSDTDYLVPNRSDVGEDYNDAEAPGPIYEYIDKPEPLDSRVKRDTDSEYVNKNVGLQPKRRAPDSPVKGATDSEYVNKNVGRKPKARAPGKKKK